MSAIMPLDWSLITSRLGWVPDEEGAKPVLSSDYRCLRLPLEMPLEGSISPNKRYELEVKGTLEPKRYSLLLTVHPDLYRHALVSLPTVVAPDGEGPLRIRLALTGLRSYDISKLPWVIQASLLD
jgi:hypothetical protein